MKNNVTIRIKNMLCPFCRSDRFYTEFTDKTTWLINIYDSGDGLNDDLIREIDSEEIDRSYNCAICKKDITEEELIRGD